MQYQIDYGRFTRRTFALTHAEWIRLHLRDAELHLSFAHPTEHFLSSATLVSNPRCRRRVRCMQNCRNARSRLWTIRSEYPGQDSNL